MIKQLIKKYNLWLFQKYGFNRGPLFEKIPTIYKLCPLWSPSQYGCCEGEQMLKWIWQGICDGEQFDILRYKEEKEND